MPFELATKVPLKRFPPVTFEEAIAATEFEAVNVQFVHETIPLAEFVTPELIEPPVIVEFKKTIDPLVVFVTATFPLVALEPAMIHESNAMFPPPELITFGCENATVPTSVDWFIVTEPLDAFNNGDPFPEELNIHAVIERLPEEEMLIALLFAPLFALTSVAPEVIVIAPLPECESAGAFVVPATIIAAPEIVVFAELETVSTVVVPARISAAML
jgi:hypothetical protein